MNKGKVQDWEYHCPTCPMKFLRPEAFQKHMKKIHFEVKTACRSCPLYFEKLNLLFLHARQVHGKNRITKKDCKHKCLIQDCTYQTDNGGLMKHHMRSHTDLKPFKCEICEKQFTQRSNMKTHFNRHQKNEFQFTCEPCEKSFNSHDIYLSHLETREHFLGEFSSKQKVPFQCMLCDEIFDNPQLTFDHQNVCKAFTENVIKCCICSKGLAYDFDALNIHYRGHKNEFICPICEPSQTFNDKTAFNFHMTKKHEQKVDRRKVCRYCEQVFDNEEIRNEHIEFEHQDLKNKHTSRGKNGRMLCTFPNCTFATNSQILSQKHFISHYKGIDTKVFYTSNVKMESDNLPLDNTRKRGRPRLCDSNDSAESAQITPTESPEKKKRGRPRKSESTQDESPQEDSPRVRRARGRPKKIKAEGIIFERESEPNYDMDIGQNLQYNVDDDFFNDDYLNVLDDLKMESSPNYYNPMIGNLIKEEEIETFEV